MSYEAAEDRSTVVSPAAVAAHGVEVRTPEQLREAKQSPTIRAACALCSWRSMVLESVADARARYEKHRADDHGDTLTPTERAAIERRGVRVRRAITPPEVVAEIERRARAGEAGFAIARDLDMPQTTVARLIRVARADGRL